MCTFVRFGTKENPTATHINPLIKIDVEFGAIPRKFFTRSCTAVRFGAEENPTATHIKSLIKTVS
nr:MAG TPA_asm: hypothetical protein [Caudoviricetes sp.]